MISGDGWGLGFPDMSYGWGKNPEKLNQENWPDRGSNPGPLGERQRSYPLATTYCIKSSLISLISILMYFFRLNSDICPPLWNSRLSRCGPRLDPRSGQLSWVRFLSGLFLTCKTTGNFSRQGPRISSGRHNHHSYSPCWNDWVSAYCVSFFIFCVLSEVAPALSWSLIRWGPPCPCVVKKVCMWSRD